MKKLVVLLSALLLILAVSCNGDNPTPGDGQGSVADIGGVIDIPIASETISSELYDAALAVVKAVEVTEDSSTWPEELAFSRVEKYMDESGKSIIEEYTDNDGVTTWKIVQDYDGFNAGQVVVLDRETGNASCDGKPFDNREKLSNLEYLNWLDTIIQVSVHMNEHQGCLFMAE